MSGIHIFRVRLWITGFLYLCVIGELPRQPEATAQTVGLSSGMTSETLSRLNADPLTSTEIRMVQEQLREFERYKGEQEYLRNTIADQSGNLKEYRESTRYWITLVIAICGVVIPLASGVSLVVWVKGRMGSVIDDQVTGQMRTQECEFRDIIEGQRQLMELFAECGSAAFGGVDKDRKEVIHIERVFGECAKLYYGEIRQARSGCQKLRYYCKTGIDVDIGLRYLYDRKTFWENRLKGTLSEEARSDVKTLIKDMTEVIRLIETPEGQRGT